jgi:hypothetical protein
LGLAGRAALLACIDALLLLDAEDPTRDDPELDRPAYRRLAHLADRLGEWSRWATRDIERSALADAGRRLAAVPDRRYLGARLLLRAMRLHGAGLDSALDEVCDLIATPPVAVTGLVAIYAELTHRMRREVPTDPDQFLAAAQRLAARNDLAGCTVALGMASWGGRLGWPRPWREFVWRLREHELADVRLMALNLEMS